MAGADFRYQVPQALCRKNNRITIQLLLEVFTGWLLLNRFAGLADLCTVIGTAKIGAQKSPTVRTADLNSRITIQGSLKYQMRSEERRLQRMADHVIQKSVARK